MEKTMGEILDDPIGAEEQIMSAYMERLEDAGMAVYREHRLVDYRELDFSSLVDLDRME